MGYTAKSPRKRDREQDQKRRIQWARSRYVDEEITLDEFEEQVERILHERPPVKYPASPKRSH